MRRFLRVFALLLLVATPALAQLPRVVVVVRHAERAGDAGSDPALTPEGELRARALAEALKDARVTAIITTQFRRTQLTAAPLAQLIGTQPAVIEGGRDVAVHAQAVADAIRARSASGTVLVVGHSNTVPAIIQALGGPNIGGLCDTDYANIFTVIIQATGEVALLRGRYGAEDQPPPADCRR